VIGRPTGKIAGAEVGVVDERRVGINALFRRRIDGIQQRLASRVDCREIALERCRDNGRIAALVIPCRVGSQRRKVCRERRDCVVVCGLFGGDAVGCGLPVDPGLFRGDDIVVTDDGRLFGRR